MMQPIGPLMIEHRLIERVVALLTKEKAAITEAPLPGKGLIGFAVDFFRTYADRNHHGKEESILFKALESKPLNPKHKEVMDELVEEHKLGRRLVGELLEANDLWARGQVHARERLLGTIDGLIQLYPKHIEKEDKHFFEPSMHYFGSQEQNDMLMQFWEFDRLMIHEKYETMVAETEKGLA